MSEPKSERVSSGCRGACLLVLLVGAVIVGAIVWGAISTYGGAYQMTSPGPRTFEPLVLDHESDNVQAEIQAAEQAVAKGDSAEIHLTANELNAWFLGDPANRGLVEHLRFGIEADWLVANLSVPLTFMAQLPFVPSFRDRYFNGKLGVRFSVDHGELKVENFDLEGNAKRLPWLFTSQSYKDTVTKAINQALKARLGTAESLAHQITSISIGNNEIVVKFGKPATADRGS